MGNVQKSLRARILSPLARWLEGYRNIKLDAFGPGADAGFVISKSARSRSGGKSKQ
jgi:hypothetical protein